MNKKSKLIILFVSLSVLFVAIAVTLTLVLVDINKQFNVTFYDGTNVIQEEKIKKNHLVSRPSDPEIESKIFEDWYSDIECLNKFDFGTKIKSDTKIYGKFNMFTYTISFDSIGGTDVSDINVVPGSTITLPLTTKNNQILEGWYLDSDFTMPFTNLTKVERNLRLYAKWIEATPGEYFTVTFNPNNGSDPIVENVLKDRYAIKPLAPTKDGYTFIDWMLGEEAFNFNTKITSNITLVASYDVKEDDKFVVSFETNGGTSVKSLLMDKGSTIRVPLSVKDGFILAGWYLDKELTQEFVGTTPITSDLVLYAKWNSVETHETYTVTFNPDNGSDVIEALVERNKKVIKPENPIKEGYQFINWVLENGEEFNFNTNIDQNYTLIASYKLKEDDETFIVSFNTIGGSLVNNVLVKKNEKLELPANPFLSGFEFMYWCTDMKCENRFDVETPITENITLYAKWDPVELETFTVIFIDYDGQALPVELADELIAYYQVVEKGSSAVAPMKPEREGYRFDRWDKDFTNITKDLEVKPIYVKAYKVDFYDYNHTILKSEIVDYGMSATAPEDPTRYGYQFAGWDHPLDFITSDTIIVAEYQQLYHIVFKNYDGEILQDKWYLLGEEIIAPEPPEFLDNKMFDRWDNDFYLANDDLVITAIIKTKVFNVTFLGHDNIVLSEQLVYYGEQALAPNMEGNVYVNWNETQKKGYRFTGWDKEFNVINSDLVVCALYEEITSPILYVETESVKQGQTSVEISVYLINSSPFSALYLGFNYDSHLDTSEDNIVVKNHFSKPTQYDKNLDKQNNECVFSWFNTSPISLSDNYVEVMAITFNLDKYTTPGEYAITLFDSVYLTYDGLDSIKPVLINGSVIVE